MVSKELHQDNYNMIDWGSGNYYFVFANAIDLTLQPPIPNFAIIKAN
tara:strand:- start:132024 stop:132164 length:141 start_codon:yes stop_codon:yes gene_type:complete